MNFKLKARIVERFGSQWKFAQAVKDHESNISKVIRGRKRLKPEIQKRWAKVLGCEPEELGLKK